MFNQKKLQQEEQIMNKFLNKLINKFGPTKFRFDLNPDKAVAYGAAIIADALEV